VTYRTVIGSLVLAIAALGSPAYAGCCDHGGLVVVRGAASAAATWQSTTDPTHTIDVSCAYATTPVSNSQVSAATGVLAVQGQARSYPRLSDISIAVSCTLVTPAGSYTASDSHSQLNWVQDFANNARNVPPNLQVLKLCVSAWAKWHSAAGDDDGNVSHCYEPGGTLGDVSVPLSVG
jgi:hypothetical protein